MKNIYRKTDPASFLFILIFIILFIGFFGSIFVWTVPVEQNKIITM